MCWSLFINKIDYSLQDSGTRDFCKFYKLFQKPCFTEQLRATASVFQYQLFQITVRNVYIWYITIKSLFKSSDRNSSIANKESCVSAANFPKVSSRYQDNEFQVNSFFLVLSSWIIFQKVLLPLMLILRMAFIHLSFIKDNFKWKLFNGKILLFWANISLCHIYLIRNF